MKDFAKRGMTLGLAVSVAFALYSCDSPTDAAAETQATIIKFAVRKGG
ncbi:hypothetical protein [Treponema endosymbiont of Eucomonympha sp.]|nr:hypothetical protein [Treponema endosymbiont of Eucomonympha sp.]